jgi:molecular chaperone DnaK
LLFLSVKAIDKGTGKEQSITITGASTLPNEEVERMVNDAKAYETADKQRREQIDTKNQCDSLVYQAEKQIKELDNKISEDDKNTVTSLTNKLKEAIRVDQYAEMASLQKELQQELMNIGQKVYSQNTNSENTNSTPKSSNDNVIDTDSSETK